MVNRPQQRTTAFVTAPIAFLAAAAFLVVLGSLIMGARETDSIALTHQRETIAHAVVQHGLALARELRVQTIWNEAYEKTRAQDQNWMHKFYGSYLSQLFGYDELYVLSSDDKPVYGFSNGGDVRPATFEQIGASLGDLISAVRNPSAAPATYDVVTTRVPLGDGEILEHRAVADVRSVAGAPTTVVVSTIVPDRQPRVLFKSPPFLLVAIEDLDVGYIKRLGTNFGFGDLQWIKGHPPPDTSTAAIKALNGADVGTLAWRRDEPGWEFVRRVALGLTLALVLLVALAAVLTQWGRQQARKILQNEAEAKHAARTDALTGLPNRIGLRESLPQLIAKGASPYSTLGILSVDLDRFKEINDDFGSAVGDAVLLAVAGRLQSLPAPDAVVGRLDGDEFLILVPRLNPDELAWLADHVLSTLAEPIEMADGTRVFITASVGYALAPRDGTRRDDLMRRVALALAKAEEDGGNVAVAFNPAMDLELLRRRALETALRTAIANNSLGVAYQPIMDPTGTQVVAVESLARWTDPLLGSVSPEVFIPLAEETGLIAKIGDHVLRQAVADGLAWPGVTVAVNVSATQIHHSDVVALVRDVLHSSGFPPERLEIEITESVLLADEKRADEQIRGLRDEHVKVALDDFGSGYSSLLYLRKFGFDKLKIDRSFIEELGKPGGSPVILASVIRLGLDLKMTITAEGIETPEQQSWLRASGCHQLQGYLFSRPLTAAQMTAFLASHRRAVAAG